MLWSLVIILKRIGSHFKLLAEMVLLFVIQKPKPFLKILKELLEESNTETI